MHPGKWVSGFIFLSLVTGAFFYLTSCGQPICVGGAGDCGFDPSKYGSPGQPVAGQGAAGGGGIALTADNVQVTVGGNTHFHTGGGTPPYQNYTFYNQPSGVNWGTIGADGTYQAPATLPNPQQHKMLITVVSKDSAGLMGYCTIVVTDS